MVASKNGHLDIVKYLAGEKGASVEVAAANEWTALMMEASGPAMQQSKNLHCLEFDMIFEETRFVIQNKHMTKKNW